MATKNKFPPVRHPAERMEVITVIEGESAVHADQGNDTDINRIVERFRRTGEMPPGNGKGVYMDVSPLQQDLTEIMQKGQQAREQLIQMQAEQEAKAQTQKQQTETENEPEKQDDPEPAEQ